MFQSYIMKVVLLIIVILVETKAQSFTADFPSGAELLIPGGYKPGFSCAGRIYGYYADIINDCQVFHVCVPINHESGSQQMLHFPFLCGNQTVFNQATLVCDFPDSVDCSRSQSLYHVNEQFGVTAGQTQPAAEEGILLRSGIIGDKSGQASADV